MLGPRRIRHRRDALLDKPFEGHLRRRLPVRRGNLSDDRVAEHVDSADRPERRVGGKGDPVPPREAEGRVVAAVERRALGARRPLAPVRRRVAGDGERVLHHRRLGAGVPEKTLERARVEVRDADCTRQAAVSGRLQVSVHGERVVPAGAGEVEQREVDVPLPRHRQAMLEHLRHVVHRHRRRRCRAWRVCAEAAAPIGRAAVDLGCDKDLFALHA
mmetsp:Transcript_19784/g.56855  ORF Transcript_19784/g.56855 Transcript_19784/m.56855 type:complete len:216 (+) Transcript_19784:137-784(+)